MRWDLSWRSRRSFASVPSSRHSLHVRRRAPSSDPTGRTPEAVWQRAAAPRRFLDRSPAPSAPNDLYTEVPMALRCRRMIAMVAVAATTIATAGVWGDRHVRAQAPTASPGRPLPGPIDCAPDCLIPLGAVEPPVAVVPPGGSVTFTNFPPGFVYRPPTGLSPHLPPGSLIPTPVPRLFVTNASDQVATLTFEEARTQGSETGLRITVPAGFAVEVSAPAPPDCSPVEGQPHVVRCVRLPFPPARLTISVVPLPGRDTTPPCPPGEVAHRLLLVVFQPGTAYDERIAAHAAAGATPERGRVHDDGSIHDTVVVPSRPSSRPSESPPGRRCGPSGASMRAAVASSAGRPSPAPRTTSRPSTGWRQCSSAWRDRAR